MQPIRTLISIPSRPPLSEGIVVSMKWMPAQESLRMKMRAITGLSLGIAAVLVCAAPRQAETQLALVHATIIDGTGAAPRPGMTIVINHGRIVSIDQDARAAIPRGARIIDVAYQFLIPGLIDSHV